MNKFNVIDKFADDFAFLSNFFETKVKYGDVTFNNSEAAFQAQKCSNRQQIKNFVGITASAAKKLGRKVELREGWDNIKEQVMYEIVKTKFEQNTKLGYALLKTADVVLIEGNTWGDRFWGQVDGDGENKLGKILMRVRDELVIQPQFPKYSSVLLALLNGRDVSLPGCDTFRLFKPGEEIKTGFNEYGTSDKYFLACKLFGRTNKGDEYTLYSGSNLRLSDFLDICDHLTDDEFFVIAANNALSVVNKKRK